MDGERLKQVEEIYHAALDVSPEKREVVFKELCGEDEDLRREVEFLLSFANSSESFLETPPESLAAEMFSEEKGNDYVGEEIGHYKIQKLLGKGGMGEVYLAVDSKLGRQVAIKFMDEKYVGEKSNLNRFFFEAKSSSALNHPNIITVFEIGEFDGSPFIVTEFIDGVTLKEYLSLKRPVLGEILDIAIQIASALSSAHKAGIIHRDIKPENVMIREDGIAKVLDFGLAKYDSSEIDTEADTRAKISTVRGLIMGTPHYMSPEQARGKQVDTRTDIWSFGVLFYLMLTNNLPFQGETTSDIIASILKSEPQPLRHFVPDISPILENIFLRIFRKDQNERSQKIDDILNELKNYRRIVETGNETIRNNSRISDHFATEKHTDNSLVHTTAKDPTFHPNESNSFISQTIVKARTFPVFYSLIFVAFLSLLVVLGIGISRSNLFSDQTDSFQKMQLAKLTFDGTTTDVVAVSPDGKFIVYVLQYEGKETLMVRQVGASSAIERIPSAKVSYSGLAFSPDGNSIYYTVAENGVGTLYEIPLVGGNSRKLLENVDGKITFSPDGKTMAFIRSNNLLMLADVKGGSERLLTKSLSNEIRTFAEWSPDGETIMTLVYSSAKSKDFLAAVSVKDGTEKQFPTADWHTISGLTWLHDGSGIVISGRDPQTKFSQLWMISYPDGKASRITNDFSTYTAPGLTSDDKSLVAVKLERLFNIWTVPADTPQNAKKVTFEEGNDDGASGVAWTPEGKIVYTVRPIGTTDIWSVNADGSDKRQLTVDQGINFSPIVSSDGQFIVFVSTRSKNNEIWRMDIDGGNPIALTDTSDQETRPSFTPDGKWIVYQRTNVDKLTTIWKVNIDGGKPIQLTKTESNTPKVSPDGKFFVCRFGKAQARIPAKIAIIPIEGGEPLKILDLPLVAKARIFHWNIDGNALIYVEDRNRASNLWSQTLDESPPKQLTFFETGQIADFSVNKDGKDFVISRGNESSDVVMVSNFR